ncbi:CST complex subunit STN1 [Trifolium repens]|nr:CST complex subunit STN1 [Trifolium repens]
MQQNNNNNNPFPISLHNTHVKLLAFDFLTLTPPSSPDYPFTRKSIPITRAETLGTIVLRDYKPAKFLRFAIDDGTGCIPCILWLNHMTSPHLARRRSPQDLCLLADAASRSAAMVKVGVVARVRGKVSGFKGGVQITVTDVFVERDPNAEILHWVECVNLAKNCYNLVNVPSSSSSGSVMRK